MGFVLTVVVVALIFEYINGFHDTANTIATSISTKVLTPRQAVMLAASFDLIGALVGTAVATTVGKGLVDTTLITQTTLLCALIGAIAWNLLTWWMGLPSSSSHALIGGLCGAALASAHGNWAVIKWSVFNPETHKLEGLWPKVIAPMIGSPVCGMFVGFLFMAFLLVSLRKFTPRFINSAFGKCQVISAAWLGFSHGTNDAQKTMGIIALALYTGTKAHSFDNLPDWLRFLYTPEFAVHTWVKVLCAIVLAIGTATGGWRIIKTLGHRMVKLQPIHGFGAQTTAAAIIYFASRFGIPLSTTHVVSASIMGVGASKRLSAVKWGVVERMVWAWILTLPVTAGLAYALLRTLQLFQWTV